MDESLDRHELPLQDVFQRKSDVVAVVPIHNDIFTLNNTVKGSVETLIGAREVVEKWYNEDMDYYLGVLRKDGHDLPHLRGYEKFGDSWTLGSDGVENDFLRLVWHENNITHCIRASDVPTYLFNQHDENGSFYTPEYIQKSDWVEVFGRNIGDPNIVYMDPKKMERYGTEKARLVRKGPVIKEVIGFSFDSDYHSNAAKGLLLRNYAVFYLNQLLRKSQEKVD